MNIANKLEYIATGEQLLKIPWVRMMNAQGGTTEYRDPDFKDDLSKYLRLAESEEIVITKHGKPAGILATDETSARRYIEWGTMFTAVGMDVMVLAREVEKLAQKFR